MVLFFCLGRLTLLFSSLNCIQLNFKSTVGKICWTISGNHLTSPHLKSTILRWRNIHAINCHGIALIVAYRPLGYINKQAIIMKKHKIV